MRYTVQDGRRSTKEKGPRKEGTKAIRGAGRRELLGQGSDGPKLPARSVGPASSIQGGRVPLGSYFLPSGPDAWKFHHGQLYLNKKINYMHVGYFFHTSCPVLPICSGPICENYRHFVE